jgi:hypothetical protein
MFRGRGEMTVSDSPNGRYRIAVYEMHAGIDRNFDVTLLNRQNGEKQTIYVSNDQPPSIQRERLVWSRDSTKVVLLGDRYWVDSGSELPSGEIVFLMYDLPTQQLYCNADYENDRERIPAAKVIEIFGEEPFASK